MSVFVGLLHVLLALSAVAWVAPASSSDSSAASALTRFIDVAGDRIGYRSIGQGPPMILLNRMRGTLDTWDPLFIDELAKSNRVITVDFPGIGYSSGQLPSDIAAVADFLDRFADALQIDRFALTGWSWGGTVAQAYFLERPYRVTHAVLIGTVPPGRGGVPLQPAFLERAFKPVNDLDDEIVLFFEPRSEASRRAAQASRERIRARPDVDARIPSTPEEIRRYLDAAATFRDDAVGRRDRLMQARTPILIISGDNDISTAVENWFALKGRIPNAHLIVYPQSGHAPQHQYPQLAAAQIGLFQSLVSP